MTNHPFTWLEVDWNKFDPWRIQAVKRRLEALPALQLPSLIELGKRLEVVGRVRTHSHDATADTAFNNAPQLHPKTKGVEATLGDIDNAAAWMSLLNVQSNPQDREVVDTVRDSVRLQVEATDPGMCYRAGRIFIASPGAMTPFHMVKEHNFILQLRGRKRIHLREHRDTAVVSERARDRFNRPHSRDLLQWREEFRERGRVFDLTLRMGAYMPSTSPHIVQNGDEPSITMSFTHYTKATAHRAVLHRAHDMMSDAGSAPPAVGWSPIFDATTAMAAELHAGAKRPRRRVVAAPVSSDAERYAKVGGS